MAERVTLEARRAGLASRLRPLYAGLRPDEFERMVARIAEIELIELNEPRAVAVPPFDVGALRTPRRSRRTRRANGRTPIIGVVAVAGRGSHHG